MSKTISQLPSASSLDGTELLESVQSGNSRKLDINTIKQFVKTYVSNNITITAEWRFSTTTTEADPGNARFRLNNATQENSTFIYVDDIDKQGVDMGNLIGRMKSGDLLYIQEKSDASRAILFEIDGDAEDQTGWWKIPITNGSGSIDPLRNNADCGFILYFSGAPQTTDEVKIISYTSPLTGVVDTTFPLVGTRRTIATGQTGNITADFPVSNQHLYILVNSITTGGNIVITGVSISESTAVPVVADTETITIDTSTGQYYQSDKKWWEVTNIQITGAGITGINFNYGVVGYPDLGNRNFKILGYRCDAYAQSSNSDFRLIINKIQDDGGKKMSIVPIENIAVDSGSVTNQIIDGIRTGGNSRALNPAVTQIWLDNTSLVFKQLDFETYFSGDEYTFESATKNEGYIIRIEGAPTGGITGVDFIALQIFYKILP